MGCSASRSTEIKDEDLEFLKTRTKYDEKAIREWYQGFMNDCPSGKLSKDKFLDMYKIFFSSGNPENFCDHVFRTFDVDNNGVIDFKEFLLAVGVTTSGSSEERLKWAFRMYDIDNDGLIEKSEMNKIVQALYEMLGSALADKPTDSPQERTDAIFKKMDENGDGRITMSEFLHGCLDDPQLARLLTIDNK